MRWCSPFSKHKRYHNTFTSKREKYTSKRDRERAQQSTTTIHASNNLKIMIFCSPTVLAAIVAASGQNTDEFISCGGMKRYHKSGHHSSGSSIVDISAMRGGGTAALTSTTDDNKARVDFSSGILIHRRHKSTATVLSTMPNEYEDVLAKYHRKQEDSMGTTTAATASLAAKRNGKSSFAYSPALQSYRR